MHAMRSHSLSRLLFALFFGASTSMVSASVLASPNYPDELQRMLDIPCTPVCTVCHTDSLGGRGTVSQPFGIDMRKARLVDQDTQSLKYAVQALDTIGEVDERYRDADKDGVLDIDELRQGTNPNGDADPLCSDLQYGCRIAPAFRAGAPKRASAWLPGALLGLAGLFMHLRRRR
jgi:hypothetical protein